MHDAQRDTVCPLCGQAGEPLLTLRFGPKLNLPTHLEVFTCAADDFAYAAPVRQTAYDEYYNLVVNDYIHAELDASDD